MMAILEKVKANLILTHNEDDALLEGVLAAAISYTENYQHLGEGYYKENSMSPATEQGVIMLASHFYESRDGSSGGYFNADYRASNQVWNAVHLLLRMGREWKM